MYYITKLIRETGLTSGDTVLQEMYMSQIEEWVNDYYDRIIAHLDREMFYYDSNRVRKMVYDYLIQEAPAETGFTASDDDVLYYLYSKGGYTHRD